VYRLEFNLKNELDKKGDVHLVKRNEPALWPTMIM